MATDYSIVTLTLAFILVLLSPSLVFCTSPPPFKKLYAFGDSYTDTGNTKTSTGPAAFNYVSNPPYGETFFHHPTNRYSDGRIMIDFMAEALSLPFVPPYRDPKADRSHGVNFAVAGATAIRQGFFLQNNITFNLVRESLQTQLVWFKKVSECIDLKTTPKECEAVLGDNALVWLGEIGANDYTCTTGSSISKKTIQQKAVRSTVGFLKAMLDKGAKYIVVQSLPMTGCVTYSFVLSSPEDRDGMGCVATMNRLAYTHNLALQSQLKLLRNQYPQSVIVFLDYYDAHLTVFKNADKYGFKEQFKACCGYGGGVYNFDVFNTCGTPFSSSCNDPSHYINWDGAHFTEAVYKVMTNSVINGSHCSPPFPFLLEKKLQSG